MASFESYLRAAYPVIWCSTLEPHRAENALADMARKVHPEATPQRWDVVGGLRPVGEGPESPCSPTKAVAVASSSQDCVTFMHNLHRFMSSIEVIQAIENAIPHLKSNGSCLVILAPDADKLPPELARFTVVWDFPLPGPDHLLDTARRVLQDAGLAPPNIDVTAALGLTAGEAEDAFALSIVEKHALDTGVVAREKAAALLRQAKITYEQYQERFADLGGLENLKKFTLATASSPLSLGILLLGVPGAGKSTFCRALGNELGIPTLALDFGKLMSSLVGSSEANIRAALQAADAMGRVILYVDELADALAGAGSSGNLDSGVKQGVTSTFLKWLSDRKPGQAYVVGTTNRIDTIPPQYLRAERWDALFYIDLPSRDEKDAIWPIWERKFGFPQGAQVRPDDKDWTGAEIRTCCRIAAMVGCSFSEASTYVIPVAKSMAEPIEAMRSWAKGRCLSASLALPSPQGRRLVV